MKIFFIMIFAVFANMLPGAVQAEQNIELENQADKLIKELQQKIPDVPSFIADKDIVELMYKCAKTKRIDCAYILIKSLALSYDPKQSDEKSNKAQMLPAISIMQDYFGDSVAPLLFTEAIQTKQPWLCKRIAFAAKKICTADTINTMKLIFSLEETKSKNARIFLEFLSIEDIDLELDSHDKVEFQKIDDAVKKAKGSGLEK